MTRESSVATLRRLAEAVDKFERMHTDERFDTQHWPKEVRPALDAYRLEIAPLRTQAEVDAEIARVMRERAAQENVSVASDVETWNQLQALCREPTAPDARKSLAPAGVYDWSRVPAHLWAALGHECCTPDRWHEMRSELIAAVQAVQKAASGPPSASAAKESIDKAGAEEGAAYREVETCGCEEAEALKAQLASAEAELVRLGYGTEPIMVFKEDGATLCTSLVGDRAWDTRENRRRTFDFIVRADQQLRDVQTELDLWSRDLNKNPSLCLSTIWRIVKES